MSVYIFQDMLDELAETGNMGKGCRWTFSEEGFCEAKAAVSNFFDPFNSGMECPPTTVFNLPFEIVKGQSQRFELKRHNCSYASSDSIGGAAHCRVFLCRECGEEWEKDVS